MATDHAHRPAGRRIEGRLHDDVLLERHHYPPGPAIVLPSHAHDDYHVCLNLGTAGSYHYRGARHVIPPGSLSVIMPDEVHLARDLDDRDHASSCTLLYVGSEHMRKAAAEHGGPRAGLPYFSDPLIRDDDLVRRFTRLYAQLDEPALARDTHLTSVLSALVTRYGGIRTASPPESGPRRAVDVVRAYLHDNYAADVSLTDLARLVDLSPYHLARLFRRYVGMPPHAYQVHVRIDRAKRLLLRGLPVTTVAHEAGFFDLSHLTRHFKRIVGVPPGRYAAAAAARGRREQERTLRPLRPVPNLAAMTQNDRFQVETALSRLGRLVDDRDWSGLPELFTDIVEVDYTSLWGGEPEKLTRETLIERWRTSLSGLEATQHVIANVLTDISGDTATATANVVATHRLTNPVGSPLWTVGGTYHVRLTRTGGRWAIEALTLKVAWTDGNPDIMTRAAAAGEGAA